MQRKQISILFVKALRDADWLTDKRARGYARALFWVNLAVLIGWIALSSGGLDPLHKPLGTDFLSFYAASKLALAGHPELVYNITDHSAAERAVFGGAQLRYAAFFYPPLYLLICLPLALVPYLSALALWLATTGYACWRTLQSLLGDAGKGLALAILAFPGVLLTIAHGQNAFLTTAIFGMGILSLDRRSTLAGVFFGLLAFKPQLSIMVPVVLVATGRWRTLFATGCTVAAFVVATLATFGVGTWQAFFSVSRLARQALEEDWVGVEKMQSSFAAVRLLHGGLGVAYGVQAVVTLAAAAILVLIARKRPGATAEGATLVTASLLAAPFLLDYDLMLLAIPLASITREARKSVWLTWEKSVLIAVFILPLVSRVFADYVGIPIGPPVIFAMLLILARRTLVKPEGTD